MTVKDNVFADSLDIAHRSMGYFTSEMSKDIWKDKYCWQDEFSLLDTIRRVVNGIYAKDTTEHSEEAFNVMAAGLWIPAGRILAGAGTSKRVTLMNCYVNATVGDSMEEIMQAVSYAALTMQQGGGIGTDFSTIRPTGAILKRTGTEASGPLPFMDTWNAMCTTIRSAGDRRGAMMATMCDTHPDLPGFITAKQEKGRLTNFNVSVLVSDALMEAIKEDQDWFLYFNEPPAHRDPSILAEEYDFYDDNGVKQYVYAIWKARDLWRLITENTYKWSEPGVIFIDRINETNNLHYCEDIRCTNPCGEQPLPPHGTCNLGAVNLARMVKRPFKEDAEFNFSLLEEVVRIGTRFLDNVIDVTNYPLEEQKQEELNKRRLGLGFTGLADAFAQLGLRYGSIKSADMAERIQRTMAETAYRTSIDLAVERGPFPLFQPHEFLAPNTFASQRMSSLSEEIRTKGIRNGLILTVAPTGTISCVYGEVSSGVEPIFAHEYNRKVLQKDSSWKTYQGYGYAARLYKYIHGEAVEYPSYMATAEDLTIDDHILIQSRVQRWVDASVSKTINLSESSTYDEFVRVYDLAYNSGCKGCTTYRPSDVRGSILSAVVSRTDRNDTELNPVLSDRPNALTGRTYKIKWPRLKSALYLTVNSDESGRPYEVFIHSKDLSNNQWSTALTLMMTAIFRKGGDVSFIPTELQQIQSLNDGAWKEQKYFGSLPAYIGYLLGKHMGINTDNIIMTNLTDSITDIVTTPTRGETCPECKAPAVVFKEGCKQCTNCNWSNCS